MDNVTMEDIRDMPKGELIIAVFGNGYRRPFYTEGHPRQKDSIRERQLIKDFSTAEEFLYLSNKDIINLLDVVLNHRDIANSEAVTKLLDSAL